MTSMPVASYERIPMPMPAGPRPAAAAGMNVNDVVRILKQRIFLIIFIFLLSVAATIGLTYYLLQNHPRWPSSAAILVESPFPRQPLQFGENAMQVEVINRFVADQMFLVRDENMLRDDVLKDADVRKTSWYQSEPNKDELLRQLREELEVRQAPDSSYVVVSFATKVPEDAPAIVNTIIKYYLATVQSMSMNRYSDELGDYKQRQAELQTRLQQLRRDKESFITAQLGVPGLVGGLNVVGEMWRALSVELARAEVTQLETRAQFDNLKGLAPSDIALSPQMMLMIDQDPSIAGLKNAILSLRQQRMSLLQRVGANHQEVQTIDAQLASYEESLNSVISQKQEEARQYQVSAAETAWMNAMQAQLQLQDRVEAAKAEQRDADRKLAQYQALNEEQGVLEKQLEQITNYINQLELVVRSREMVRVKPVGTAHKATRRSFPRWEINIPAGVGIGLVLGIGLALLLEVVDTSIKTPRDLSRHVHIPVLGTVPDVDDEEVPIDKIELAVHQAPRSLVAEAFRTVRANLQLSSPAERQRTLLVTSARPEEGKSTVASNLAIALAQSNRRVLLVDANFHRPALRNFFPTAKAEGLSNVLIGQANLEDVVSSTELPNLDVLSSGPIPPNPAELLASSYLADLLTRAMDRYDQVIFDGPPILLVSDALVLAGALDGVLLVCRAKASSRGVIQRGREQLERANIRIFGAVLNAAQVTRGGYFREQIRTYYEYQPTESLLGASMPPTLPANDTENK